MNRRLNGDPCACAEHCCDVEHQAEQDNQTAIENGELTLAEAVSNFVARCEGATSGGPCSTIEGAYHAGQAHGCPKAKECALKIANTSRSNADSARTSARRRTVS